MSPYSRRKTFLPFALPSITIDEINAVTDVLRSGWLTTGSVATKFESLVAEYVNAPYAVSFNSCTAAMHTALAAWEIGPGDEVITSPLTFCSTVAVIEYAGATPVLVDIDPETGNFNPKLIEKKITAKTKCVIPVHYGGLPCHMDLISEIAEKHDLLVLEDAAHAFGAEFNNRKVGSISKATAFSFYATKNITTGEGGMLSTSDPEFADRCRSLSLHAISKDAWQRYAEKGKWFYQVDALGFKYNLPDLLAAIGVVQLERIDTINRRRAEIAKKYNDTFISFDFLDYFPRYDSKILKPAWHLFPLLLNLDSLTINRDCFVNELQERNIGTSVHFIPIYHHPYYKRYLWDPSDFPNTEKHFNRTISLPIYPDMSDHDVDDAISAVYDVGQKFLK